MSWFSVERGAALVGVGTVGWIVFSDIMRELIDGYTLEERMVLMGFVLVAIIMLYPLNGGDK